MKKLFFSLILFSSVSVLFHSCEKQDDDFDETLLYGKWKSGTLYYKYLSDHNGSTWDTSEDVQEDEAQPFTWTLVNAELRQIHLIEGGGNIPKVYTVTELTASTLKYREDTALGGKSYSFTKVTD
jgi:hypothetical protein